MTFLLLLIFQFNLSIATLVDEEQNAIENMCTEKCYGCNSEYSPTSCFEEPYRCCSGKKWNEPWNNADQLLVHSLMIPFKSKPNVNDAIVCQRLDSNTVQCNDQIYLRRGPRKSSPPPEKNTQNFGGPTPQREDPVDGTSFEQ